MILIHFIMVLNRGLRGSTREQSRDGRIELRVHHMKSECLTPGHQHGLIAYSGFGVIPGGVQDFSVAL